MGGCRCSFHNCKNTTNIAKETNSIHSHFFHFPIRDLQRCKSWAIYSNNMSFLSLPLDKLKNKVICDKHFPESSFMNYTRSKLNKTTAIPTIFINEQQQEVDLLSSPTDWVERNKNADIPLPFKDHNSTQKIDIDVLDVIDPAPKKLKIDSVPKVGEMRILNKLMTPQASSNNKIMTIKQVSNVKTDLQKSLPTATTLKILPKTPVKIEASPQAKAKLFAQESDPPVQETYEFVRISPSDEQPVEIVDSGPSNDEIRSLVTQTSQDINEIKQMLATKSAKCDQSSNINPSQFNKVQLFNGIKRYLSPSLIALLRMELFAGPTREYKKDEKIICWELLRLGDETYDFLSDEWRLRLPSKEQVRSWQYEEMTDDDAC